MKKSEQSNKNPDIHGILIQAPLPSHIDERDIFNHVLPRKDVDGFQCNQPWHALPRTRRLLSSCTPAGIIEILKRENIDHRGQACGGFGRSLIVGKPVGMLMLRKGFPGNSTVTFCHSRTPNLREFTQKADILIAAIGKPHFVDERMVKKGATVIDVGINRVRRSIKEIGIPLVGDVNFEKVAPLCTAITPVPGGVGPMTVAMLMS